MSSGLAKVALSWNKKTRNHYSYPMLLWQCTIGCVIENTPVMLDACTGGAMAAAIPLSW